MLKKLARLRAKKGFTLIEMIVVISIIGILTSIVIASLSYDNRPTLGRGIAKDLYYVAQDALSTAKIATPNAIPSGDKICYFAEVNSSGNVDFEKEDGTKGLIGTITFGAAVPNPDGTVSISATATSIDPTKVITHDGTAADDKNALDQRMYNSFKTYLSGADNMSGTLYVMADDHYRVTVAYWSDAPVALGGDTSFTENYRLGNGYFCCSYPVEHSLAGKSMFDV